jgi:hypothetical protein
MAVPFCTACGAAVAEGTRFCVKCGQQVGQTAPQLAETVFIPPSPPGPPPPPPPIVSSQWTAPPPPPPPPVPTPPPFILSPPSVVQPPPPLILPVKKGAGAGVWIGIFGILLLLGGAGFWLYTMRARQTVSNVQVAAAPTDSTPVPPTPTPTPASTLVPAPTPTAETEPVPTNPDQAPSAPSAPNAPQTRDEPQKGAPPPGAPKRSEPQPGQNRPQPVQMQPAVPVPDPGPAAKPARQTSGVLHAAVEVAQNGEVVFENLPSARLKFTFDHSLWQPTISRQANGTQTLVMRSLKPGIQRTCDVRWEIVQ